MNVTDRDVTAHLTIQSTILEMIALRGNLDEILEKLCLLVQEMIPSSVASLMLIDRETNTLMVRSAPGLPEETQKCFDGLALSPQSGSCGTAAYTGEMVIVEDTLSDPRWAGLRDLARKIQKFSCWSIPVLCNDEIVGTFAPSQATPVCDVRDDHGEPDRDFPDSVERRVDPSEPEVVLGHHFGELSSCLEEHLLRDLRRV